MYGRPIRTHAGLTSSRPQIVNTPLEASPKYINLLKTGLGILDFYHSDWLNGARLSAHIPAVTKYGQ